MLVTWTPRRTDRSAINLRRFNANKEDAVEPPVPSAERLVVLLRIHGTATIRSLLVAVSPFSDMKISDSPEARPNSQSPIANSQLSFGLSQTSWLLAIGYRLCGRASGEPAKPVSSKYPFPFTGCCCSVPRTRTHPSQYLIPTLSSCSSTGVLISTSNPSFSIFRCHPIG